jgi:hypothetical protein
MEDPYKWKPSFIRFGVNTSGLFQTAVLSDRDLLEGMFEIDFHKYFLTVEGGIDRISRSGSFDYSSQGTFFRVGIEQNLIPYSINRNVITVGLRYAYTSFSDEITFSSRNVFQEGNIQFRNEALTASWLETGIGLRGRIWKNLYMGYQLRVKLFKRVQGEGVLETFDVPGFGKNKRNGEDIRTSTVGFDYFIYWTIPFRDKIIGQKPIKFN